MEQEMNKIRTRLQGGTPFFPNMLNNGNVEVCLKEDVDKAIAEKDEEIAELKKACNDKDEWCLHTLKENRHQKFKRCLAMAWWCDSEMNYWYDRIEMEQCQRFKFYDKWHKRWLELAEVFKETK